MPIPPHWKGGRLAIGFLGTFDSLNPFNLKAGSTAQGMNGNVFETLMTRSLDEPFTLYGLIAQTIETPADRSSVTFRLDPRAHFSDGAPITSADVRFTFELLKTKGRPQQRAAYSLVKSIETPDALTIRYDLTGIGDREMPLTLALMPVLPRHKIDPAKFDDASLDIPTGSGPYIVADVKPGQRIILRRDPNYWAKDLPIRRGLYNFDEIDIEYFRDANSLFEAFAAGLLDFREETNPARWTNSYDFPAIRDHRMIREALPAGGPKGMEGFVFNLRRPLFDDIRVREALGLVFDFEWINANLYNGLYKRTKSFFDDSELASTGRPADAAELALLAPFPGAVREDILQGTLAAGRDRRLGRRPDRAKARPRALERGRLRNRRRPPDQGGPALVFRDHGEGQEPGAARPQLRRCACPDRRHGNHPAGRRSPVSEAPAKIRFRHDDRKLARLGLARQRAARALGLGERRPGSLVQSRRASNRRPSMR